MRVRGVEIYVNSPQRGFEFYGFRIYFNLNKQMWEQNFLTSHPPPNPHTTSYLSDSLLGLRTTHVRGEEDEERTLRKVDADFIPDQAAQSAPDYNTIFPAGPLPHPARLNMERTGSQSQNGSLSPNDRIKACLDRFSQTF